MATGPAFAGCPTGVCEETLFGCCDDGETPASALPKAKRRRRRQAEESGDGKRLGNEQTFQQYLQGETSEASGDGDDASNDDGGTSGEGEEDSDGSGDAAGEEEGEDETKCEENKKCQNGKFGE